MIACQCRKQGRHLRSTGAFYPYKNCLLCRFIVLLSGLNLADSGDTLLPLQLFVDWIGGFLGDMGEQEHQACIVRVVVAGT